ncbi:SprT family protein [Peribacillus asahii]|uniref:SprT family protein n=1 Tax=Peribacillus asahii TaxID=228899 RepID=UPI0038156CB1
MNDEQLQTLVEAISLSDFQKTFEHRAYFNPRLRTTGGRYLLTSHNIEINKKYYEEQGMEELIGIVKHELCHYHLHLEKKGYQHKDADFKHLLKKVGAPRFCKPLAVNNKRYKTKIYEYSCKACHQQYMRKRRVNINRFVCGKCKGVLSLVREI